MNPAQWILVVMVRVYQWTLSPLKAAILGPAARCRFHPSCSVYAVEAISRHGAGKGIWLSTRRLLRCHPWGDCGLDPVPERDLHRQPISTIDPRKAGSMRPEHSPLTAGSRH